MSTVERAAEVILDWFMDHYYRNGGHEVLPDGTALAAALAAAGLLADPTTSLTDEQRDVIGAAEGFIKAWSRYRLVAGRNEPPVFMSPLVSAVNRLHAAERAAVDRLTATEETT